MRSAFCPSGEKHFGGHASYCPHSDSASTILLAAPAALLVAPSAALPAPAGRGVRVHLLFEQGQTEAPGPLLHPNAP